VFVCLFAFYILVFAALRLAYNWEKEKKVLGYVSTILSRYITLKKQQKSKVL